MSVLLAPEWSKNENFQEKFLGGVVIFGPFLQGGLTFRGGLSFIGGFPTWQESMSMIYTQGEFKI